ncbi:MAG TPA: hypothetical protein VK425_07620, partial [Acidimicrobiales bacterium]|nr:hypothetical protein [Acidimicrobiales bacterium]
MAASATTLAHRLASEARPRFVTALGSLLPAWSRPAALRALRTTVVVPPLFALSVEGLGNLQIAIFAAFGGFATLLLASFGGTRRDKLLAHSLLAFVGGAFVVLGTAVSGVTALAACVTALVAFCVLFAGIAGGNAASGATGALLAFVLPAASKGALSTVPAREAGWWMASAAGMLAVMLLSPRPAGDRVRSAAASVASTLAEQLDAVVAGAVAPQAAERADASKHALISAFAA